MVGYRFRPQDGTDFEVSEEVGRNFYETIVACTIYNVAFPGLDPGVATLCGCGVINTTRTYAEVVRIKGALPLGLAFWPRMQRLLAGRPQNKPCRLLTS